MGSYKKISVAIITFNIARRLKACLESVKWADEIIIVDSGSKDDTLAIAKEYTDKIFKREFDNFSKQKNYAISKATNEWVLSLDGDEVVTEELADELKGINPQNKIRGFYIERRNNIYGEFLYYGRPDYQLRFFKKNYGSFTQPVHERIDMPSEQTSALKEKLLHYTMEDISHHVDKLNEFTDYDVDFYPVERTGVIWPLRKLLFRPFFKFIQHYYFKKAFKDGMTGYIFSINTIIGEFLTHAKYCERSLQKKR